VCKRSITCAMVLTITASAQRRPCNIACLGTPSLNRPRTIPVQSPASTTAHAHPEPAPLSWTHRNRRVADISGVERAHGCS
jgi:hypothetical protein